MFVKNLESSYKSKPRFEAGFLGVQLRTLYMYRLSSRQNMSRKTKPPLRAVSRRLKTLSYLWYKILRLSQIKKSVINCVGQSYT